MAKRLGVIKTTVLVLMVGVWSSHCILSDCFGASRNASHNQSSHCHRGDEGTSKNHGSSCQGAGCCQPAISGTSSSLAKTFVVLSVVPTITNFAVCAVEYVDVIRGLATEATGPPLPADSLVLALTSAPNAPPRS